MPERQTSLYPENVDDQRNCILSNIVLFAIFLYTFTFTIIWVAYGAYGALHVPIEYAFCFICREKCMRKISSRKYIDLFQTVYRKITTDATNHISQKVGGVTKPLIFYQG